MAQGVHRELDIEQVVVLADRQDRDDPVNHRIQRRSGILARGTRLGDGRGHRVLHRLDEGRRPGGVQGDE